MPGTLLAAGDSELERHKTQFPLFTEFRRARNKNNVVDIEYVL